MPARSQTNASDKHVVVVSPHFDDAVLSLGAFIAQATRDGTSVVVLTVFGCDSESTTPTRGWDARAGFRTEGQAARSRREEDRRACAILGAIPVSLTFGSVDYDRHGDERAVREAVIAQLEGADAVLMPGHPLSHPDHAWLAEILEPIAPSVDVGRYAEQPYTARSGRVPTEFERVDTGLRDRLAKWRAVREYGSQLSNLAMRRSLTRGPLAIALSAEAISWQVATLTLR